MEVARRLAAEAITDYRRLQATYSGGFAHCGNGAIRDDENRYTGSLPRNLAEFFCAAKDREPVLAEMLAHLLTFRFPEDWNEEDGPAIWWRLEIEIDRSRIPGPLSKLPPGLGLPVNYRIVEPPCHVGTPLDDDFPDGYPTHWSPLPEPSRFASIGEPR